MTARFSIIPAGAVTDRSLEPRDLQVLCLLGRHTDKLGWCFRSQVKMAAELDCGRASVQRSLERLYEAGWLEKKLRSMMGAGTPDPKHPHAAHAYRVRLDRDDLVDVLSGDASHDENADQGDRCPPVGTPSEGDSDVAGEASGVPENGHPGAHPSTGTGCPPIHGHMNDPKERPSIERERDARARDREARGLVDFEARWPTAAADDRQRTAYAWAELSDDERERALTMIAKFLENLKRLGRKNVPAGWKYLEEKRWTLLEAEKSASPTTQKFAADSNEAKALDALHLIAGKTEFLNSVMRSHEDRGIRYRGEITPRLLALANAPASNEWATLNRQQAAAWNEMLVAYLTVQSWNRLIEGARAPWSWPPRKDGTLSTTGPPDTLMTDQDVRDLDKLKAG